MIVSKLSLTLNILKIEREENNIKTNVRKFRLLIMLFKRTHDSKSVMYRQMNK